MSYFPLRLNPGDDLRSALEALVTQATATAFVVCGIGSLSDPRLRLAGADGATDLVGCFEILTLSGAITPEGAHLHMSVADAQGRVWGGHVVHGNRVRTTAEVLLVRPGEWALSRVHDPATGFKELAVAAPSGAAVAQRLVDTHPHAASQPVALTDTDICALEHARTQALVNQDMASADALHAADYQLITPGGKVFDRARYLAAIASGELRYLAWQVGAGSSAEDSAGDPAQAPAHDGPVQAGADPVMAVRRTADMAIVRYPAVLRFGSGQQLRCWHTDSWELRAGRWQAVWSQATARS